MDSSVAAEITFSLAWIGNESPKGPCQDPEAINKVADKSGDLKMEGIDMGSTSSNHNGKVILSHDFAQGLHSWYPNSGEVVLVPSESGNTQGLTENYALVKNRTKDWQGLELDITSKVYQGVTYKISACVGMSGHLLSSNIEATLRLEYVGNYCEYKPIKRIPVSKEKWETLEGTFTIQIMPMHVFLYLEGPEPGVDLLIKSVVIFSSGLDESEMNMEILGSSNTVDDEEGIGDMASTSCGVNERVILRHDFDEGLHSWVPNCCEAVLVSPESGNTEGVTGNYALVKNRTKNWQGLELDITSRVYECATYKVSACVGMSGHIVSSKIEATLRLEYVGNFDYKPIKRIPVSKEKWETLEGTFTIPTMPNRVVFYLEGPEPGVDLLIKSVVISRVDLHGGLDDEEESMGSSLGEWMTMALYKAAASNRYTVIHKKSNEYLCRKTRVLNNILHIAVRHGSIRFFHEAVKRFPDLMWEENDDGNTAFHIAAEMVGNEDLVNRVCEKLTELSQLKLQNKKGNTALHVALVHNNFNFAKILINKDLSLASIVNHLKEAPLHLVMQYYPDGDNPSDEASKVRQVTQTKDWNIKASDILPQQKMVMMIALLLEKDRDAAFLYDAGGSTPLHKAAYLNTNYNLYVIQSIIDKCQLSAEVCDRNNGKTILHHLINRIVDYEEGEYILKKTLVHGLINHQDHEGNTAFHLAVINNDFIMLQILQSLKANMLIKNMEGLSAVTLIQQTNILKKIKTGIMMSKEINDRAECGDVLTLIKRKDRVGKHFLQSHSSEGRNLVHKLFQIKRGCVIVPKEFLGFIEEILDGFEHFLSEKDNNGDTPLHILAQLNPDTLMVHMATVRRDNPSDTSNLYPGPKPDDPICFSSSYRKYDYIWEILARTPFLTGLLALSSQYIDGESFKQDLKGNTALHVAILAKNYPFIIELARFYKEATILVNNRNETVLHLLASLDPTPPMAEDVMGDIITNNTKDEHHLLDEAGLSPIMRAIQANNIEYARRLWSICPRLAELKDPNGQTFWHLLVNVPPKSLAYFENSYFANEAILRLLDKKDKDENTALHLAIKHQRFDVAKLFLGLSFDQPHIFNNSLLGIPNKEGNTPGEMIGSLPYLPPEFEKFVWKDSTMIGTRSMWGIPTMQMEGYVNTMGVIAALLTTITFTAAFTVPGGLEEEKGTPLLIKDSAFQVFIISDVFAMCLSMMVLFCLLWIMATGDKSKSVVLLDFSIILLLASFYTTLLTFMTGLYAMIHLVKPWIAIVSLVPCSMLLLLMHKYFIIKLIIPSGKVVLIFADRAYHLLKRISIMLQNFHPYHRPQLPMASDRSVV